MINTFPTPSTYWYWMFMIGSTWLEKTVDAMTTTSKLMLFPLQPEATSTEFNLVMPPFPESHHLKDDFVTIVGQELRTPLASIRAASEILCDNPNLDPGRRKQLLDIILKDSERLSQVVNQTLDLTEMEVGSATWSLSPVDLNEVIDEALAGVSLLLVQKNVKLEVRLPDQVPPIMADRTRLRQVLFNLLTHAINFCDSDAGWVGVRLQIKGNTAEVDISNNGPSLSTIEQYSHLFDEACPEFEHAWVEDPQTANVNLLTCSAIIAHFGGKLWIDHRLDHGIKFSFTLPLKPNS